MLKKVSYFVLFALAFAKLADAAPVTYSRAKAVADRFVLNMAKIDGVEAKLVYSPLLPNQNRPAFYAFNYGNDAFVIVAGDDISFPILAYSFSNGFPSRVPANIDAFLSDLTRELDAAIGQRILQDESVASQWDGLMYGTMAPKDASDTVGPLLSTQWDQNQYYNSLCPLDSATSSYHTPVGCEAVAMAQIIRFWQYPMNPRGSYSYNSDYGVLGVNFDTVEYSYTLMPNQVSSGTPTSQVYEVASLLYHCGISLHMDYGPNGSSATNASARASLVNHFGYSANMSIASKAYYSTSWNNMLKAELDANRPLIYSGRTSSNEGHAFVCDGYTSNYFHFNFGWSGWGDGYYLTSAINPTALGVLDLGQYNSNQAAIFGIQPDSAANVLLSQNIGNSSFVVDRPLDFYNIKALNAFSNNQFGGTCSHYITFAAQDSSKRLCLEIVNPNSENLYIFDGDSTISPIRQLTGNNTAASLSPVISSGSSLTLRDLGITYNNGFQVRVSEVSDTMCYAVSNVHMNMSGDSVFISWSGNGEAQEWQVEYGPSGFAHGNGTIITIDTSFVSFASINVQGYDFYVRSICDSSHFSQWSQLISFVPGQNSWVDVVTSLPSGYVVDGAGNVTISSPAGFAWLISVVNGLNGQSANTMSGKTVTLATDVDMGTHKWTAIDGFAGHFDGQGFAISNITIDESSNYQGLFGRIQNANARLSNIVLDSCNISGGMYVGSLCGELYGSVDNCSTSGSVRGTSNVGALIGRVYNGEVMNCSSSTGVISTNGYAGGLVGMLRGGRIINSFSQGNMVCLGSYIGGIVGSASALYGDIEISNCYYSGLAIGGNNTGALIGELYGSYSHNLAVSNLYSNYSLKPLIASLSSLYSNSAVYDTILFSHLGTGNPLSIAITIDNVVYQELTDALNAKVVYWADTSLRMWNYAATANDGYPEFGDFFHERCSSPSDLAIDSLWSNGCILSWIDTEGDEWQIEYGIHGFNFGNGTVINVTTPMVTLDDLAPHTMYDIYVRGLCEDSSYSRNAVISLTTSYAATEYWYEVVTTQPSGYSVADNYDIHISSNEGLAWLLSVCNGLNGAQSLNWRTKRIILDCDVDMSEYLWTPMKLHKTFDGRMHTITGLTIDEDSLMYLGFVESLYSSDTIRNVILKNSSVNNRYAYGYTGGLVGDCHGTILNCGVSGMISSVSDNTGGVAGNNFGNIINVYSTANISGRRYVGGISGDNNSYGSTHSVLNCYATGNIVSNNPYSFLQDYAGIVTGKASEEGNGDYLAYWLQSSQPQVGCGNDIATFYPFNGSGIQWNLVDVTTIGGQSVSTLLDALNLWVVNNNDDGSLCSWTLDLDNLNGGFPVFSRNNSDDTVFYTLSLSCNDYTMGSVTGNGVYPAGSNVTVSAIPFDGFSFSRWSDNDTNAVRVINMLHDISLMAYFDTDNVQGIEYPITGGVVVYSFNNRIHINNTKNENVVIYSIDGRMICNGAITLSPYLSAGVYLVKVGNNNAVKIVVAR